MEIPNKIKKNLIKIIKDLNAFPKNKKLKIIKKNNNKKKTHKIFSKIPKNWKKYYKYHIKKFIKLPGIGKNFKKSKTIKNYNRLIKKH